MDPVLILDVQEQAFRLPKEPREVLNGIPFCGCIDDSKHLLEMTIYQLKPD